MSESWTFPIVPKSHNQLHGRHWSAKNRERGRWGKAVLAIPPGPWFGIPAGFQRSDSWPPSDPARVRLRITAFRWALQDPDNATASVKPLVDALIARGWAVDDSARWLELEVREEIDRGDTRTVVEWEGLE